MELTKTKSLLVVFEGFAISILFHWISGEFFSARLVHMNPNMPHVTASMVSSSAISPALAIGYMYLRVRFTPRLAIGSEMFFSLAVGIVLTSLVVSFQTALLEKEILFVQEILDLRSEPAYYYLSLFLLLVWGPIFEEIWARGYFFEILRRNWGDAFALLVSSFLFVLFHAIFGGVGYGLFFIFLDSLVLTFVYIQGGLIPAALTHIFINTYFTYLNANL